MATKFSVAIKTDAYKNLINETLGDVKVAQKFVAEISTCVANNYKLQECEAKTIISAGLLAQSLNLPLAPTLGFAYVIPYKTTATFQIGWKGLVQLAIRTGAYERIGVKPVHEGELAGVDEFGDDIIKFDHKFDTKEVIGYYAYFKLINGFTKSIYWTKAKCEEHAKRYSRSYGNGTDTDNWTKMFDEMAMKTVLKQLISKWGIMSTELTTAVQADQAVVKENGEYDYVDNEPEEKTKKLTNVSNSL